MKIRYREDFHAWWPDYDHAPEKNYALVKRNLTDMDVAIRYCKQKRVAVQAGGHAGFWPARLATMFDRVYTFECEPLLYECLTRNCAEVKNLVRSDCALGADQGMVSMRGHCSAGSWRIEEGGEHKVVQVSIDQLKLKHCDAIFLDIEGYEPQALKGAENTIARCRPIIMVEELPRSRDAIAVTLDNLGYRFAKAVHKDRVYIPKERRA